MIDNLGFPIKFINSIKPIIEAIQSNKINEAELQIARLTLDICNKIKNGNISYKEGDVYFTLLSVNIISNFPELELREEIKRIIFEGEILHDYGKYYGANINVMETLANIVLTPQ